jgi:hypothetical protein
LTAKKKTSKIEKFNLGLGIFNFIGLIVSISIAVWAIKSNESIAEKSGVFDKGELKVSFGGYFFESDSEYDVYYGINFKDSTMHFAGLPIAVHNQGKKTLENINILFKYPHVANLAVQDSLFELKSIFIDSIERKFLTVEPFDEVCYKLHNINPNFSILVDDQFYLRKETISEVVVPVATKDNKKINVSTSYKYAYKILIGVTGKDVNSQRFNINLNYRNETDLNKLLHKIIKEKVSEAAKSGQMNLGFVLVIPKVREVLKQKNIKISQMTSDETTTLYCEFDKEISKVSLMNQDGSVQSEIPLK